MLLEVTLIAHTAQPEILAYVAARRCSSDGSYADIESEASSLEPERIERFLAEKVLERGHVSVFEHVTFTYHISGVSRACTHQLVRHRIASYSQMSQRSVRSETFVRPPGLTGEAEKVFDEAVTAAVGYYERLLSLGVSKEDARYVLPNAAATALVMTVNARELIHICHERLCGRAQAEIRGVARQMAAAAAQVFPLLQDYLGPKCLELQRCPEGKACSSFMKSISELEQSYGGDRP